MSVETELAELAATKAALQAAIEAKGPTVGSIPFAEYPAKIAEIVGGGAVIPSLVFTMNTDGVGWVEDLTGQKQHVPVIQQHTCIEMSPDGSYACASSLTAGLTVIDPVTLSVTRVVAPGAAKSMAFSPDGTRLAVAETTGALRVYDTTTWGLVPDAPALATGINAVAYSPNGLMLAVGSQATPYIRLYDLPSMTIRANPAALPAGSVTGVAFTGNNAYLACQGTGTATTSPAWYDTSTWVRQTGVPQFTNSGGGICPHPDGFSMAISNASGNQLTVVNSNTWTSFTVSTSTQPVAIRFLPGGATAIVLTTSTLRSYTVGPTSWTLNYSISNYFGAVNHLSVGDGFILSMTSQRLERRTPASGFPIQTAALRVTPSTVTVHPGGAYAVFQQTTEGFALLDLETFLVSTPVAPFNATGSRWSFSPDGSMLAVGMSSGSRFTIYDTDTWTAQPAKTTLGSTGNVVQFSPDGNWFAALTSTTPYIHLYDVATWTKRPNPSELPTTAPVDIAWASDSSVVYVLEPNTNVVKSWDVATWSTPTLSPTMSASVGALASMRVSPDDGSIVIGAQTSPFLRILKGGSWRWSFTAGRWTAATTHVDTTNTLPGFVSTTTGGLRTQRAYRGDATRVLSVPTITFVPIRATILG